jgi:putative transposase
MMNYMQFPKNHWKKIRTINMMERPNKEIKTRSRVIEASPNQGSILK